MVSAGTANIRSLPKEEEEPGLVNLESRGAAFRLQFLHCCVALGPGLETCGGLGLALCIPNGAK